MKRLLLIIFINSLQLTSWAQCAICTKTASQLGEEAGRGFNAGILYLAAMPFGIMGYVAYRWWKSEKESD
jgi:hypothetical protein